MNIEEEILDALTELQTRVFEEAYECASCQFETRTLNAVTCSFDRTCELMDSQDSPLECPGIVEALKEML